MDFSIRRNLDFVFCIDGTGSMEKGLDIVQRFLLSMRGRVKEYLEERGAELNQVRFKLIVFRDYLTDEHPMEISPWFVWPEEGKEFSEALSGIIPSGGGDIPENGFEAFYYACQSDFVSGPKDRQFIILLTDGEALRLGERSDCPFYPEDMIEEEQLKDLWEGNLSSPALNPRRSRAIFVAPKGSRYEEFANELERAAFYEVRLGEGLSDLDEDALAKAILYQI